MPTTTDKPLEGLPVNGVFPLSLSPAFIAALGKGKGAKEDVVGLKYTFKPESITPKTEGRLEMDKGKASQLTFDTKKGSQVFDIRDEASAQRECVIVWDPMTVSFTIHPLPTTLNLTLNRNLSGQPPAPAPAVTKRKATEQKESPKKKSRPSAVEERKSTGGKSLPKKSIPVSGGGGGGKVKSAEIIESESESEEEDDDFAALLGAEMAKNDDDDEGEGEEVVQEVVDYEDSTSGEEDDDFEL